MKKLPLIVLLIPLISISKSAFAQCTSCYQTITTSNSSSISVPNNKRLCISATGSVSGSVSLGNNAEVCNMGTFAPSSLSASWGAEIYNHDSMVLPSSYHVTKQLINNGYLKVNGNLTSNSSKSITNAGNLVITGNLQNEGSLTNSGTINVGTYYTNKKTFVNSGTFTVATNFTNSNYGGASGSNTGTIIVGGNFTNQNSFSSTGSAVLAIQGDFNNSSSGSTSFTNGNEMTVGGDFTNTNDFTNNGDVEVGGDFTNSNSGSTYVDNYGSFLVEGDFSNYQSLDNFGEFVIEGSFMQTNTGSAELNNDSTFTVHGNLTSNNDIYNGGALTVGGTYTNQNYSGIYHAEASSILVVDSLINQHTMSSAGSDYGQIQVISYSSNSGSINSYVDICMLSNNGNWNANTGTVAGTVTTCSENASVDYINLNVRAFLEFCYDSGDDEMNVKLRSNKVLPTKQPYRKNPWGWKGNESVEDSVEDLSINIVDWVLVSFRTSTLASSEFWKKSFFLTKEGYLRDGLGNPAVITRPDHDSFYVVVTGRNHLGVMSSSRVKIAGGGISYDFSTSQSKAYTTGANPMIEVETGVYALVGGDANGDGTINTMDAWEWYSNSGLTGYKDADLNLDNNVNSTDKNLWKTRNGMSVQFPID